MPILPWTTPIVSLCLATLWVAQARGAEEDRLVSSNPAKVVTATFIGSEGTEWFTSAVFPGDDSIIIAGVSLDPELVIHGVKARVLGKDAPPLPATQGPRLLGEADTGRIEAPKVGEITLGDTADADGAFSLDEPPSDEELKKREREAKAKQESVPVRLRFEKRTSVAKKDVYVKYSWLEPQATAFVTRFDSSLKKVRALYRFPRGSSAITSVAVGKQGDLYVAGFANERIRGASTDCREEKLPLFPAEDESNFGGSRYPFIARLSGDLSKVVWLREIKKPSYAPALRMLHDGNVSMMGPGGYLVYTPDGKLVNSWYTGLRRVASGSSVCPETGRFSMVGDWLAMTGREPMRCPRLMIMQPDGRKYKQLQTWSGKFFCPNHFHLVADSAVRRSAYDQEGNLLYSTWSHGGNNCLGRLPYDPERRIPNALGYVGGSTYCYVVKLDPEHNVKTGTLWTSAGGINTLAAACDGSPVWAGSTPHPYWMPNTLSTQDSSQYLVVADPNLAHYRFFSALPACGSQVVVGGCRDLENTWGFVSGVCAGRPMLLCLSGAVSEEFDVKVKSTPPLVNPAQAYGGGFMDGYALLLDLTPTVPLATELPKPKPEPQVKAPEKPAAKRPRDPRLPPLLWPTEGQVWKLGENGKVTVTMVFRDSHEEKWPNFFMGKGVKGGSFTFGTNAASANFSLAESDLQQGYGLQHQRILGELVKVNEIDDGKGGYRTEVVCEPGVKINVTGMSPWERTDECYEFDRFPVGRCTISGTLEFMDRAIPFKDAVCKASFSYPFRDEKLVYSAPTESLLETHLAVTGKDLGLKAPLDERPIRIRIAWEATSVVDTVTNTGNSVTLPDLDAAAPETSADMDLGL
ncbi:hypothetical protein ACFLQU_01275 [Verrucomicrobiota bacterium]